MSDEISISELLEQIEEIGQSLIRLSGSKSNAFQAKFNPHIGLQLESDIDEFSIEKLRLFARVARHEYQSRLMRYSTISRNIFGEPAWDMLLDLFIARVEGVRLSVKSVGIASQVPLTTALRWITVLEEEGLLERSPDASDGRRVWIELSDLGVHRMFAYFKDLASKPASQSRVRFVTPLPGGGNEQVN